MKLSANDPRLQNPKFRACLTYNSVHPARAAAKELADSMGWLLAAPTRVVTKDRAVLHFMRVRDQADEKLIEGQEYQYVEIVETPDDAACVALMQSHCKAFDGIDAEFVE